MRKDITKILATAGTLALLFANITGCAAAAADASADANTAESVVASETEPEPTETTLCEVEQYGYCVEEYPQFYVGSDSLVDGVWSDDMAAKPEHPQGSSPSLYWEPVEGATCYAIYMVDLNTHYFLHWVQGDITETTLPQGYAGTKFYKGMYPPPGDTHVYNIYVFALKNPVTKVKGTANTISAKLPDFMKELDTDKDGNTGNIIAVGKVSGKFTGK